MAPDEGAGAAPPGRRRLAGATAGFTIIEMLIVLVIVALISGILLFAFQRILDIRVRLAAFLEGTDVPTLIAGWFRGSVAGLLPDQQGGRDRFVGTARRFSGLSVAPIDSAPGVPVRITWELAYKAGSRRTELRYREQGRSPMTVASWPGKLGGLSYCRADLACSNVWPPAGGKAAELPALIRLEAVKGTTYWPILAAPLAARDPLRTLTDMRSPQP